MAVGLRIFDASSNIILDTTTRVGRFLGQSSIGTTSGGVTDANLSSGTPFWTLIPLSGTTQGALPTISLSGTTLSWTWPSSGSPANQACVLLYGVY